MTSIPASELVLVTPSVLGAGSAALSLNSVFVTQDSAIPVGSVASFATSASVESFFGATSDEAAMAAVYFAGFNNATVLPSKLYFTRFNSADVAAYLRSASMADVTLSQLQALSGVLTLSIDGVSKTSATIDLSSATSFTNAAALIQTGLQAAPTTATVSYDSQRHAFVITSPTTGASSSITFATGTLSTSLRFTSATGAVLSQGAVTATAAGVMNTVVATTQNWALFTTVWEPDLAGKTAFADWVTTKNDRYAYVAWDSDISPTQSENATGSFGRLTMNYDGVMPVWGPADKAAFICGMTASINFTAAQGRITYAYKSQSGLTADVTDATVAQNLLSNGYNFYGDYATDNDQFQFLQKGQISGTWNWADSYVNQIKLNSDLQLAFMDLLTSINSLPYNSRGYNLLRATAADPINSALNFGSIQPGVELSARQIAEIDTAAGQQGVGRTVSQVGYYLQILPASAPVRAARGSPPMTLWYADGGSIQKINLASINVQ